MIRQATGDDAEGIARLHIASWRVTYNRDLPAEFLSSLDLGARAAYWHGEISRGVTVLLAEEGAGEEAGEAAEPELAGFVACGPARDGEPSGNVWQIYTLHVGPARHRQGIGSMLFRSAVEMGRECGAGDLMLWVAESNTGARTFYESLGMGLDGGRGERLVGDGYRLETVRYRMRL